jgi:transmembrane sensor
VQVLGTVFRVEHRLSNVRLHVVEGEVQVLHGTEATRLSAGEDWSTALSVSDSSHPPSDPAAIEEAPPSAEAAGAPPPVADDEPGVIRADETRPDWRQLAKRGQFQPAYDALRHAARPRGASDLLLAADAARLSHHPADAVIYLRDLLGSYRTDPRAALAAFTLGKVLLDDLGKPIEAARAFAESQALDPRGALAEDALAREVEAHWRALDESRARERAERYLKRYPSGRRAHLVRRFGGVD